MRIFQSKINQKNVLKKDELKIYSEVTDNELNSLSYDDATSKDKRTFYQTYMSLIRTRQLLFFTFKCKNDYNSGIIKFCFFFFIFAFLFFINTLFVDELTLHNIFITGGNLGILHTIPIMFYSVLITSTIKNILLEYIFTENNILSIKETDKSQKREVLKDVVTKVTLKCSLYFYISFVIVLFIWIYIACFFTVFKNMQFFVLKNTLISFGIFLAIPFAYYVIPAALRIISLESRESKNRLFLYALAKILLIFL